MVGSKLVTRVIFVVGFLFCLYPLASNIIEGYYQRNAVATYQKSVENTDSAVLEEDYRKAEEYNETLYAYNSATLGGGTSLSILGEESYNSIINMGNGVMGSIEIPKINVYLPIYHGTSDEVLSVGVGHVYGSSLPVGGTNTRSILSAHRGLPNAKLFTRLDEIVVNDLFFIKIQDKTLAYKVRDIQVIDPDDIQLLNAEEGQDLVSLVTCTPYGLNTHRLVVTGERVPFEKSEYESIQKETMSFRELLFAGLPFAFVGVVVFFKIKDKRVERRANKNEVKED